MLSARLWPYSCEDNKNDSGGQGWNTSQGSPYQVEIKEACSLGHGPEHLSSTPGGPDSAGRTSPRDPQVDIGSSQVRIVTDFYSPRLAGQSSLDSLVDRHVLK